LIIASVYLLIILFFIYKNGFFGIFTDKSISPFQFVLFFIFKCLAIPVFYYIYQKQYNGIDNYDAGIFLRDSKIVNSVFYENPWEYIKLLLGFENGVKGTELYEKFISHTGNWDEGRSWRLMFNDNRSIIRLHSLIHFISFGNYFVHALISCLLGYMGIMFIYRSMRPFFISKEILLFGAFVCLPNLWLFSGALLKEPLVLLNIGLILMLTDRLFNANYNWLNKSFYLLLMGFIIYYLKPHITFTVFSLYFLYKLVASFNLRVKPIWYLTAVAITISIVHFSFVMIKGMSMFDFINKKQTEFYDVARGGIFLKDDTKFVRLSYNYDQVVKDGATGGFRIKSKVPFYYWEDSHQRDTLFNASNSDTITSYKLIYDLVPANSGYAIPAVHGNMSGIGIIFQAVGRSLGFPLKFGSFMNAVVSLEGLFLALCLVLSLVGLFFIKEKNLVLFFLSSTILLLVLFGIATPNLGAIVRYRSLVSPFAVLSILYIINHYEPRGIRKQDN
jgi:hypothetical protein